jgi:hypothetical protein
LSLHLELTLPDRSSGVFFGGVADADVSADGTLLVLDALTKTIYRFRPDGSFLDSLGRPGQGPGELRQPVDIEVGPAGEIAVADGVNGRVTYWTPAGQLAASTRILGWPAGMWWRPSGLYLKTFRTLASGNAVFFYRLTPGADTTGPPRLTFTFERDPRTLAMRGVSCDLCPAAITRQGEAVVVDPDPVAYRVAQIREGGAVVRVWERTGLPPVGFTSSELQQIRAGLKRVGLPFEPQRHKYRPRIGAIAIDEQERLWVLRRMPEGEPPRLDVFGPDGRLLAELRVPGGVREFVVRSGRVLTIGETPDGEPVVHVYRIGR